MLEHFFAPKFAFCGVVRSFWSCLVVGFDNEGSCRPILGRPATSLSLVRLYVFIRNEFDSVRGVLVDGMRERLK